MQAQMPVKFQVRVQLLWGKNAPKDEQKIELSTVISIDNEKQKDENFLAFILMINKEKNKISKLTIIDTTFLNRHYNNQYAKSPNLDWQNRHKEYLKGLEIPYVVIMWENIMQGDLYKKNFENIKLKYTGNQVGEGVDEKFRATVNQLAEQFKYKGPKNKVVDYILDECAGALTLSGFVTYPGAFNAAIQYCFENYKTGDEPKICLIPYKIKSHEEKKQTQESFHSSNSIGYSPDFFASSIAYNVSLLRLPPERQLDFQFCFLLLCKHFKEDQNPQAVLGMLNNFSAQSIKQKDATNEGNDRYKLP